MLQMRIERNYSSIYTNRSIRTMYPEKRRCPHARVIPRIEYIQLVGGAIVSQVKLVRPGKVRTGRCIIEQLIGIDDFKPCIAVKSEGVEQFEEPQTLQTIENHAIIP